MNQVVDIETWLAQQGAGFDKIGDPALHRQPRSTPKSRARLAKRQNERDVQLCQRREELRKEYWRLVAAGEIRPPTRIERLIQTAQGHPENEAVQAARRILARMDVPWN